MNRDIISVLDNEGNLLEVEVCLLVTLSPSNKKCIIYKKLTDEPEYFAAHYTDDNLEHSTFDYDFTDIEKEKLNNIFEELVEV